jgi:hypothetical protein
MKRVDGTSGASLIECVNPVKNKWRIRWDVREDENNANYIEEEFDHRPEQEEIRDMVFSFYNGQTNSAILSGFTYEGNVVWLSQENQFNYKAQYDLAVQTKGKSLPATFKFGMDEQPVYREFAAISDLSDFYTKAMQHIQDVLAEGWRKKDNFDVNLYQVE